jgi:hypothetical protein
VLRKALRTAGIQGVASSNGTVEELTRDVITLFIGFRQRDSRDDDYKLGD